MRKILILLTCICFLSSFAQEGPKTETKTKDETKPDAGKKPKAGLATGLVLFTDIWRENDKAMTQRAFNQGVDIYVAYNVPVENTPLSFSLGTGLGFHNLYNNCVLKQDVNKNYYFAQIHDLDTARTINYKKSKISVTYWDFPLEFRYREKGGFTLAIGMKFGLNINSLTKYKGDDYTGITGDKIKMKVIGLDNMVKWRYGFTARMGYKMVELCYFYSLTNIFKTGEGPEIAPMSLGISVRPLFMESKK